MEIADCVGRALIQLVASTLATVLSSPGVDLGLIVVAGVVVADGPVGSSGVVGVVGYSIVVGSIVLDLAVGTLMRTTEH